MGGCSCRRGARTCLKSELPHQGGVGIGTAVGEVIQQRAGRPAAIIDSKGLQDRSFKALDQMLMRIFFSKPFEGGLQEVVQGSQVGVRFGHLFDHLGEVSGSKKSCVGMSQSSMCFFYPSFSEVVESCPAGGFPGKVAFMKEVEMAFEWVAWFGSPPGEGAENSMATGQPNSQQARFSLSADIE